MTRVVDGDTLKVNIGCKEETVRLIGVDTPETVKPNSPMEPYGKEASNYTKSTLEGKTVYLEKDVEERDRYGRLLAYAWITPPAEVNDKEIREKMFNARLLLDGYAQLMTFPPNVKYVDYFKGYQREAREGNKGLWGLDVSKTEKSVAPTGGTGETVRKSTAPAGGDGKYIGNSNSKKFHQSNCRHVGDMNPANKVPFNTREVAVSAGYEAYKVCKP